MYIINNFFFEVSNHILHTCWVLHKYVKKIQALKNFFAHLLAHCISENIPKIILKSVCTAHNSSILFEKIKNNKFLIVRQNFTLLELAKEVN